MRVLYRCTKRSHRADIRAGNRDWRMRTTGPSQSILLYRRASRHVSVQVAAWVCYVPAAWTGPSSSAWRIPPRSQAGPTTQFRRRFLFVIYLLLIGGKISQFDVGANKELRIFFFSLRVRFGQRTGTPPLVFFCRWQEIRPFLMRLLNENSAILFRVIACQLVFAICFGSLPSPSASQFSNNFYS